MDLGASVSQGQPSRDHDLLANTGGLLMMLEVNGSSVLPGECPPPPQAHTAVLSGHPLNSTLLSLLFPFISSSESEKIEQSITKNLQFFFILLSSAYLHIFKSSKLLAP